MFVALGKKQHKLFRPFLYAQEEPEARSPLSSARAYKFLEEPENPADFKLSLAEATSHIGGVQ